MQLYSEYQEHGSSCNCALNNLRGCMGSGVKMLLGSRASSTTFLSQGPGHPAPWSGVTITEHRAQPTRHHELRRLSEPFS